MCGIAGILTPGHAPGVDVLQRMVREMTHRGPDAEHIWDGGEIVLGMRRLSIVDIEGGAQPLSNESGSIQAVFNGEIYNHEEIRSDLLVRGHQLSSRTDGAIVPHLYEEFGDEMFGRLDGIFAIALWDSARRILLLARDQLGVKPLYFHRRNGEIRFASEIKSLLQDPAVPRRLDLAGLDEHLTYRFTPAPRTLMQEIEKLEPGALLKWHDGATSRRRYWRTEAPLRTDLSFGEAAELFRDRLRAAVHRQMMSDRPIGVMLSGGIDSAAILAFVSEKSSRVKTFTFGWEGRGDDDETALARETARLYGADHHELIAPPGDFAAELPAVIEMLEEPVVTGSAFGFRQVSRLARPYVPVLLSGQGADELLGGYWRYVGEAIASRALRAPKPFPLVLPYLARASVLARSARVERGLRALRNPSVLDRFMDIYAVFTPEQKRELYGDAMIGFSGASDAARTGAYVERLRREVAERDPLDQMMYVDLRLWLPDDLLLVGDKMSMAESIEMRVPFIDPPLVDFVESLPSTFKVRWRSRKALERAALRPVLPRDIVERKQRGFVTPLEHWLRDGMRGFARELLLSSDAYSRQLFRSEAVESLLRRHEAREFDHTRQIFCLLSFELWARRFLAG